MAIANKEKRKVASDAIKNIKMHSAGYKIPKPKKSELATCYAPGSSDGIDYPSMYLNSKNVPELKGYDVEDGVLLLIKGKVTSHSLDERRGNKRETWDIEIKEIACLNKKEKKDKY